MNELKYFIVGLVIGFAFGYLIMNIPDVMKETQTYYTLQRRQIDK